MVPNGEEIVSYYNRLNQARGTYLSHLQEIANYMVPRRQQITTRMTPGGKRMNYIYDGTALNDLNWFSYGLNSLMTSPSYPWFVITIKDKDAAEDPIVKWWLAQVTERMRTAINASNASSAFPEIYTDLGWAGTGVMFVEQHRKLTLNHQTFSIANVCIAEDAAGFVDTVLRLDRFTARQFIQQWGEDAVSEKVRKAYKENKKDQEFEFIHAVMARDERDWRKADNLSMPYMSVYVEKEEKNILSESGYNEFPYMVPRWDRDSDEVEGRSPAMNALPDTKMLNQMEYDNTRAVQKRIDPPLIAEKESLSTTRTTPGGIIYHKSGSKPPTAMDFRGDMSLAFEFSDRKRKNIDEAFWKGLFALLQDMPPTMTAYEVRERLAEKMELLGTPLGRLQIEFYNPYLIRAFWVMARQGMFPPVPRQLLGHTIEIEYVSKMALAMKAFEKRATFDTIQTVGALSEIDPYIIQDNFNIDEVVQGTALSSGMPVKYIKTPDMRDRDRKARAEQVAREKADQADAAIAQAYPNMTTAPEKGSPAEAAMQMMGMGAQ